MKCECKKCGTKFEIKMFSFKKGKCPNCKSARIWYLSDIFKLCVSVIIFTPIIFIIIGVLFFLIHPIVGSIAILVLLFALPFFIPGILFTILVRWKKDDGKMPNILKYMTGLLFIINFIVVFIITFLLFGGISSISFGLLMGFIALFISNILLIYLYYIK